MKVTIINTGGTFNKRYNPLNGELEVPNDHIALDKIISSCHNVDFEIIDIISKDSLDITKKDRKLLVETIQEVKNKNIIIIHGTDTVDKTAKYVEKYIDNKTIIFTGAMVPMSIDVSEATMNFSQCLGFISADVESGIYLSMHGVVVEYDKLLKNKELGQFLIN